MKKSVGRRGLRTIALGGALLLAAGATGCQVDIGGQTQPSPYWHYDDVQYFPQGPDMRLAREAQAMEDYKSQQDAAAAQRPTPGRIQ